MRVAGSGGFAVNIMADNATLNVQGTQFIKVYQVRRENDELSPTKRHFCSECVSIAESADLHQGRAIPMIDTCH
jgi:hypothetical protein